MKTVLWLDDERNPENELWTEWLSSKLGLSPKEFKVHWVKTFENFCDIIAEGNIPEIICFDHDLGENFDGSLRKSGYDAAKYLVEYCLNSDIELPIYFVQSANPVGKMNIEGLLKNFEKFQKNYENN